MNSDRTDPASLPVLPPDADGPVFSEPWEAQAFALTLQLHEGGHFTWAEWADRLSAEIRAAAERGEPDLGRDYYRHWLTALERLLAEKGLLSPADMADRKQAWADAAAHTPHGQPIELNQQ